MFGAQGNSILNSGLKSNSPAAASYNVVTSSNIPFPYHSTGSPDHFSGLVGITGEFATFFRVFTIYVHG